MNPLEVEMKFKQQMFQQEAEHLQQLRQVPKVSLRAGLVKMLLQWAEALDGKQAASAKALQAGKTTQQCANEI